MLRVIAHTGDFADWRPVVKCAKIVKIVGFVKGILWGKGVFLNVWSWEILHSAIEVMVPVARVVSMVVPGGMAEASVTAWPLTRVIE